MTNLNSISLVRFGLSGAAALFTLALLAGSSQAAPMSQTEFYASVGEVKRICKLIDSPMWVQKYSYGCGKEIACKGRLCHYKRKPQRPRPTPIPIPTYDPVVEIASSNGDNGDGGGGNPGKGRDPNGRGATGAK